MAVPRLSEVRKHLLDDGEEMVDFAPARALLAGGDDEPVYLMLTEERLIVVRVDPYSENRDTGTYSSVLLELGPIEQRSKVLRVTVGTRPFYCRFMTVGDATAFHRLLRRTPDPAV
jgi:hypothetical protein